jgi:hypothetical protein
VFVQSFSSGGRVGQSTDEGKVVLRRCRGDSENWNVDKLDRWAPIW